MKAQAAESGAKVRSYSALLALFKARIPVYSKRSNHSPSNLSNVTWQQNMESKTKYNQPHPRPPRMSLGTSLKKKSCFNFINT